MLIHSFETVENNIHNQKSFTPTVIRKIPLKQKTLEILKQALYEVVNAPSGTAYLFGRSKDFKISGKTGTAQVVSQHTWKQKIESRTKRDHELFVAYAPSDNPQIAVSVVVENGLHGSSSASPKAKHVIETYLNKLKSKQLPLPGPMSGLDVTEKR
jgi:penicillin-binding protein 2